MSDSETPPTVGRTGAVETTVEGLADAMPFTRLLGAVFTRVDSEEVRARLDWSPERCTTGAVLHGGALMALADSTGGACAFVNLPAGPRARPRWSPRRTSSAASVRASSNPPRVRCTSDAR